MRERAMAGSGLRLVGKFVLIAGALAGLTAGAETKGTAELTQAYGRLPMRFEANQGQVDGQVRFLARGSGYGLYLTEREAVLALRKPMANGAGRTDVIRMQLVGADGGVSVGSKPVGVERLPGVTNYLMGSDASGWHTGVAGYGRVRYGGVYPGVDLEYYGNQRQLEYDFVVAAGSDPGAIQMHFEGATGLRLDRDGGLVIAAGDGEIGFHAPVVYQMADGRRVPVAGRFELLTGNRVGFVLGAYDRTKALVIDPTLQYSTYLGGSNQDAVAGIAVDSSGAAYLTGTTYSTDFPATPGVLQATDKDGHGSAFITKLNASGTALIYSTFVGGSGGSSGGDAGQGIAVDSSGNAYITGFTYSKDFPVTSGAYQKTNKSATSGGSTAFVTKLNATGTALVYSTYVGGSGTDNATSLALDSSGDVYVVGVTISTDFPVTAGVFQTTNKSAPHGDLTQFVTKLNPAGSALLYSTYLGGTGDYLATGMVRVAVDSSGDAFVAGNSYATDYPVTTGAYQTKNKGKAGVDSNLTLTKLNPTATGLLYSTYIGGTGSSYHGDVVNGLAIDGSGNAYLTGPTYELDYPVTSGAFQKTNKSGAGGLTTIYVTKMNAAGSALVYSTYLGGSGRDTSGGLALDSSGNVYVTGSAASTDFPVTTGAYQTTNPAANINGAPVFLTELNTSGSALVYSTYFGGQNSFSDNGNAITVTSSGNIYLAGATSASDFPISAGAYQTTYNSQNASMGFVTEFTVGAGPTTLATGTTLTPTVNPAIAGMNVGFAAAVTPTKGTGVATGNVVFSIDQTVVATVALNSNGYANYTTTTPLSAGQHAILASYAGNSTYANSGANITESVTAATPVATPGSGVYPSAVLVSLTDSSAGATIYYTLDGTTPTTASTKYTGPFLVNNSLGVSALASLAGAPLSPVTYASYTLISAPYALAMPASAIASPNATLNGQVNSYGMAGTYSFSYGTSATALTSSTAKTALAGSAFGIRIGIAPVTVSARIAGLLSKTTYYYQVVVTTAAGTSSGAVLSFTTN